MDAVVPLYVHEAEAIGGHSPLHLGFGQAWTHLDTEGKKSSQKYFDTVLYEMFLVSAEPEVCRLPQKPDLQVSDGAQFASIFWESLGISLSLLI